MKISTKCLVLATIIIAASHHIACKEGDDKPSQAGGSGEQWFFRAVYGYPVSVSFEPLVLFENGDYVEVGATPVEDMDVRASKQSKPISWGRWEQKDGVWYLTNSKGKTTDYKLGSGSWFPAFPYDGTIPLKPAYSNTTNTTIGDGTTMAISKINFLDDNYFIEGENIGSLTPNSAAWKENKHTGTYTITGHTLTLAFEDGRTERRSFAFGSSGNPAKATNTMIFIGGYPYTD